jgi:hypothetical protein
MLTGRIRFTGRANVQPAMVHPAIGNRRNGPRMQRHSALLAAIQSSTGDGEANSRVRIPCKLDAKGSNRPRSMPKTIAITGNYGERSLFIPMPLVQQRQESIACIPKRLETTLFSLFSLSYVYCVLFCFVCC